MSLNIIYIYINIHIIIYIYIAHPNLLVGKLVSLLWLTSSTAQGSGGSFKNRKPIGEVGCCEPQMAEANPLMD